MDLDRIYEMQMVYDALIADSLEAQDALVSIGTSIIPISLEDLDEQPRHRIVLYDLRRDITEILYKIGDVRILIEYLNEEKGLVYEIVTEALTKIGTPEALTAVKKCQKI